MNATENEELNSSIIDHENELERTIEIPKLSSDILNQEIVSVISEEKEEETKEDNLIQKVDSSNEENTIDDVITEIKVNEDNFDNNINIEPIQNETINDNVDSFTAQGEVTDVLPVIDEENIAEYEKNLDNDETKNIVEANILEENVDTNIEQVVENDIEDNETNNNVETNQEENKVEDLVNKMIDNKINNINSYNNVYGTGKVTKVMDFVIEVSGLENAFFYEKVKIGEKAVGYVMKLEPSSVIVSLLSVTDKIYVGDYVTESNEELMGIYSDESIGRVVDLLGNDKLNNKKFANVKKLSIDVEPLPIMDRTMVNRPLETGIKGIDLIYPIGRGQRQLIIGDKKTGKTQILLDTIVNQANKNVYCIYVAIGKTKKEVKEIYFELMKRDAIKYTTIITAFYDDLPPLMNLTPYFAMSVAEQFMFEGKDVLVCIDDLKRHADAYREISLLSGKSPGRDAYPADIFYSHSRLLERGCQYKNGGSITVLPVVETKGGVITDYISTNIISITDGQIVLSAKNFQKGEKPAINYGLSVSRLGGAVQTPEMKKIGSKVKQKLLSYLETRDVYELANTDEMSKELQQKLIDGKKILDGLSQYKFSPVAFEDIKNTFSFIEENND